MLADRCIFDAGNADSRIEMSREAKRSRNLGGIIDYMDLGTSASKIAVKEMMKQLRSHTWRITIEPLNKSLPVARIHQRISSQ